MLVDYGAVGMGPITADQQQAATVMQMLQAERRMRLLEYKQRKFLESGQYKTIIIVVNYSKLPRVFSAC